LKNTPNQSKLFKKFCTRTLRALIPKRIKRKERTKPKPRKLPTLQKSSFQSTPANSAPKAAAAKRLRLAILVENARSRPGKLKHPRLHPNPVGRGM
jgi:hypothetical protein